MIKLDSLPAMILWAVYHRPNYSRAEEDSDWGGDSGHGEIEDRVGLAANCCLLWCFESVSFLHRTAFYSLPYGSGTPASTSVYSSSRKMSKD